MIPLFKPYMPENLLEVQNILQSGALAFGKWGNKFEQKLAEYLSQKYVLTFNSYNSAMLALLTTLDIGKGDEIIASPMSCLASNQPFAVLGAKVVWADIDPLTGSLNPNSVEEKISKKTRAIFHNHFCGYLGYIDEINNIGRKYGVPVIDDAIEAFGSVYKGKKMGAIGTDITVFSFETVRFLNCISAGALVFSDKEKYEKAKIIRDYGIDRSNFRDELNEINPNCDVTLPGYGSKPSEINCYLGVEQLKIVDKLIYKHIRNSGLWKERLDEFGIFFEPIQQNIYSEANNWVKGILANNKREKIIYLREKGFYASGVHINNNIYSVFGNKDYLRGVFEFNSRFIALPCGWWL